MSDKDRVQALWTTEERNPQTMHIDTMASADIVRVMCQEEEKVLAAVREEAEQIAGVIDMVAAALRQGKRLLYVGAGTSGRVAVMDAVELLPTFGVGRERVRAMIAGGPPALTTPVEGAEDDAAAGQRDLEAENVNPGDIVVGISASGRTPYVLGALERSRQLEAKTVAITCNRETPIAQLADVTIAVVVGPEVISGSTRLKAGTAQKTVLNILSTGAMVQLGKVYRNLMVDMLPTNEKLRERATRIVCQATDITETAAKEILTSVNWDTKVAILVATLGCNATAAAKLLEQTNGVVAAALRLGEDLHGRDAR